MMTGAIHLLRHTPLVAAAFVVAFSIAGIGDAQAPAAKKIDPAALQQVGATPNVALDLIKQNYRDRVKNLNISQEAQNELIGKMVINPKLQAVQDQMKVIMTRQLDANRPLVGAGVADNAEAQKQLRKAAFKEVIRKSFAGVVVPPDLLRTEQSKIQVGTSPRIIPKVGAGIVAPPVVNPATFDWRDTGVVPSVVRNQDDCQTCWAFSAVGVAECSLMIQSAANTFAATKPDFSEQFVVSAMGRTCQNRGHYTEAWDQVLKAADGIPDEGTTPVSPNPHRIGAWGLVNSTSLIPTNEEMKTALREHGPLAVCMDVEEAFMAVASMDPYAGESNDERRGVDHAVILVGWTNDGWIIRNSWGPTYGLNGYQVVAFNTMNIGYTAAWATYGLNGTVVTQNKANLTATKSELLGDEKSQKIWRNLAIYQAKLSAAGQVTDANLFDLRPGSLRAETREVPRATEANRPFLKTKAEVEKEWPSP